MGGGWAGAGRQAPASGLPLGPEGSGAQNDPAMDGEDERGRRALLGMGLALVVTLFGVSLLALAPAAGSLDDVFVVLTEARRLLTGLGSGVPGPVVESWTSPADLLAKVALLGGWPGADPLRAAGWLALLGVVALAGTSVALLRGLGAAHIRWAVAALGLISAPGLLESAAYRLEGPLFGVVWLLAVTAAMKKELRWALAWSAMLGWIRPEGMALGVATCWLAVPGASSGAGTGLGAGEGAGARTTLLPDPGSTAAGLDGLGRGAERLGVLALSALLTVVPVSVFRRVTYGAWLPNSYHAKRSDRSLQEWMDGAEYAAQLIIGPGGLALVALAGLAAVRLRAARREGGAAAHHAQRVALTLAGLALAILVASGGDSYQGARLALPVGIPLWLGFAAPRLRGAKVRSESPALARLSIGVGIAALALQTAGLVGASLSEGSVRARLLASASGPAGMEIFAPEQEALEAATRALDGETFAHRHLQRLRWFCPEASILDLTGLTDRGVAALPAPGPVKFGRDAVAEGLRRGVGALHLDPVGVRSAPLAGAALVPALASPAIAARFGGPPFLDRALAQRLDAGYLGASFPVAGGFVNLLVRRDLGPRFVAQGFLVAGLGPAGR